MSTQVNYAKLHSDMDRHHRRYVRRVESRRPRLTCQECGGAGGETDVVLDYGQGLFVDCGYCEGTGLVTPWMRGQWLKWKREEKLISSRSP